MTNEEIGQLLKKHRLEKEKSLADVGKLLNMSRQNVGHYEKGRIGFTSAFLTRYCNALGVTWELLIQNNENFLS